MESIYIHPNEAMNRLDDVLKVDSVLIGVPRSTIYHELKKRG